MARAPIMTALLGVPTHPASRAAYGPKLVRARTIRFTISLWLSGSAYLFILTQVLLSLIWSPS